MKPILGIAVILGAAALIAFLVLKSNRSKGTARTGIARPNVSSRLREKLFSTNPRELGLAPSKQLPNVWGVVMEIGFPDFTATMFSLAEGTTSLYLSSGGGVIGGGQHEAVRRRASEFLFAAERALPLFRPTTTFPLAGPGMVRFYILAYSGIYFAEAPESLVTTSGHPLFPLFSAGHDVMTELRLIDQEMRPKGDVRRLPGDDEL